MKLPERWYELRYHAKQDLVFRSQARFIHLACGRGSGKTEVMKRKLVLKLPLKRPWSDPIYFFALPTYNQAKRVAWNDLIKLIPDEWIVKEHGKNVGINVSDMCIETIFGSKLFVVGLDQPQRIEGNQWDGGVIDESSDQKPGVFDRSIRPALTHKKGFCHRIGVPKRYGIGAMEYKESYDRGLLPAEDTRFNQHYLSLTWPSSDILDEEEIAELKGSLSPKDYSEQCDANWEKAGGLVYHAFDDKKQVTVEAEYRCFERLAISCDFNVSPMAWVIGHIVNGPYGKQVDVFDQIYERDTNTPETLDLVFRKYGDHEAGVTFYGDASSRARKTSAVKTDYLAILNDNRWKDKKVMISSKNPQIIDRYASVNGMLCNTLGHRRVRVHPRCTDLIRDLNVAAYKEGTRELNDQNGSVGHITDALGYLVWTEFPIRITKKSTSKVIVSS